MAPSGVDQGLVARIAERQRRAEPLPFDAGAALHAAVESILVTEAELEKPGPAIVYANPAFERMTGWRSDEIVGKTPRILQGPQTDFGIFEELRPILSGGGIWSGHTINQRKDGTPFWVDWTIAPVRSPGGAVTHFLAIQRDVSVQVAAERQLKQALEDARAADRAKAEFLAVMTHELRSPLNGVLGYAEMIASEVYGPIGDARYARYAGLVHSGAQALLGRVNDILDYSKGAVGALELEAADVELRAVLEGCVDHLADRARAAGVALTLADGGPTVVPGDSVRLGQVFTNLIGNAIKFNRPGGRVWIAMRCDDEAVTVAVGDDGPGIPADQQARIFEPFVQADSSLRRRHEGTGLGLAIVDQLVRLHGGRIEVESAPGAGAEFRVALPPARRPATVGAGGRAAATGALSDEEAA